MDSLVHNKTFDTLCTHRASHQYGGTISVHPLWPDCGALGSLVCSLWANNSRGCSSTSYLQWICLSSQNSSGPSEGQRPGAQEVHLWNCVRKMTNEPWNMGQSVSRQGFRKAHVNKHRNFQERLLRGHRAERIQSQRRNREFKMELTTLANVEMKEEREGL